MNSSATIEDPATDEARTVSSGAASCATLRLLSYNVQVGISTSRPHHYITRSWKHLLPHPQRLTNLDRIAETISQYDIVGVQELDAGSLRSGFLNLTDYLATRAGFPFWHHQVNRRIGNIAQNSHGLLSRAVPHDVQEYRLPGLIPGRGAIVARYGDPDNPLAVFLLHLALSPRARQSQLDFLADLIREHRHVVLMGDFNCQPHSREMARLFRTTDLCEPESVLHTFPSWKPDKHIDHILITPSLRVVSAQVLQDAWSDHLPIAMEIGLPDGMVVTPSVPGRPWGSEGERGHGSG